MHGLKRGAAGRTWFSVPCSLPSALPFPCAGTRFLLLASALDSEAKTQVCAETAQQGRSRALVHRPLAVPVPVTTVAPGFAAAPSAPQECIAASASFEPQALLC